MTDNASHIANIKDRTPRPLAMRLGHVIRFGLLIFLAVNFYAVALCFVPVPSTLLMVQRSLDGNDVRRDWIELEDISPYMVQAVMAGEDTRFCEHDGIDWSAIEQALEDNQEGGRRRGGSTITQQTAKNVFFWNGGGYIRKAGEAWFASLIDFTWGKSRVMEVYLNVVEWGDGIFGVEAAAENRFGKSAKNLSQQEAALLAAVLPSPHKWRLDPPTEFVRGRAGVLRKRMAVIRNSGYASCVTKITAVHSIPQKPASQETSPKQDHALETDTPPEEPSLEEVLAAAEKSLEKKQIDLRDTSPSEASTVTPSTHDGSSLDSTTETARMPPEE